MLGPREAGAGGRHCGQNRPVREEEWEIRSERLGGGAGGGGSWFEKEGGLRGLGKD